jgi:hypothetical protein
MNRRGYQRVPGATENELTASRRAAIAASVEQTGAGMMEAARARDPA